MAKWLVVSDDGTCLNSVIGDTKEIIEIAIKNQGSVIPMPSDINVRPGMKFNSDLNRWLTPEEMDEIENA